MAKQERTTSEEFFAEHFPYEIDMLRVTFALLNTGLMGPALTNALIESFCVHARNLIEFFKAKESCDFDPRDFATPSYQLEKRFLRDSILPKINNQISHLTDKRTSNPASKINGAEITEIKKAIEMELARFKASLREEWRSKVRFQTDLNTPAR